MNLMEFPQAGQDFQNCLTNSYELNYQRGIGLGIFGMGSIMLDGGNFQKAEELFLQAIPILQGVQADEVGWCLALLVYTMRQMGQTTRVWQYACQGLELAIRAHVYHTAAMIILVIAALLVDEGEVERAIELHTLATRYPLIKSSPWFHNMAGQYVDAAATNLPSQVVAAARGRGQQRDLFSTAEELLEELSGKIGDDKTGQYLH